MAAFSGFFESQGPPPSCDARGTLPAHCNGHQNGQQSRVFCIVILLIVALAAAGRYVVSSRPMAAFSGFYESPGPPPLGGGLGIAPVHRMILTSSITVAK